MPSDRMLDTSLGHLLCSAMQQDRGQIELCLQAQALLDQQEQTQPNFQLPTGYPHIPDPSAQFWGGPGVQNPSPCLPSRLRRMPVPPLHTLQAFQAHNSYIDRAFSSMEYVHMINPLTRNPSVTHGQPERRGDPQVEQCPHLRRQLPLHNSSQREIRTANGSAPRSTSSPRVAHRSTSIQVDNTHFPFPHSFSFHLLRFGGCLGWFIQQPTDEEAYSKRHPGKSLKECKLSLGELMLNRSRASTTLSAPLAIQHCVQSHAQPFI